MRILTSIACILFCAHLSVGQEVEFGLSMGTNAFFESTYKESSFAPENAYVTYHERTDGEGVIYKRSAFNAFYFGGMFSFSYKRFSAFLEPQFGVQRTLYDFEYETPIQRIVGKRSFRLPFYFTYKFWKKQKSLYLILGTTFNADKNFDFQKPGENTFFGANEYYLESPDFGDYHMYGLLYDENPYFTGTVGFGKRFNRLNVSVRYVNAFAREILAENHQFELHLGFFMLSTKDFTKKHYLYVE